MVNEIRGAVDHSKRLENPTDLVERTEMSAKGRNESKAGGRIVNIACPIAVGGRSRPPLKFWTCPGPGSTSASGCHLGEVDPSHLVH